MGPILRQEALRVPPGGGAAPAWKTDEA